MITSGGTKVPIDRIRDITNMSHGTFGSKIAYTALEAGHKVVFFHAKGSCTPFTKTFDYDNGFAKNLRELIKMSIFGFKHRKRYDKSIQFRNFEDYKRKLELICDTFQPNAIILAAAVSDYGVKNYVAGKIRTSDNQSIELYPLPKIIRGIKKQIPNTILVGFKLLVDNDIPTLIEAAKSSIDDNDCDLVVANTLHSLINNNHTLFIMKPHETACYRKNDKPQDQYYLARSIIKAIEQRSIIKAIEQRKLR